MVARVLSAFALALCCAISPLRAEDGAGSCGLCVPAWTVAPVATVNGLNSGVNQCGDRFQAITCGPGACFPENTIFVGEVTFISRKHYRTPGQMGVRFIQAILPDCSTVAICATPIALDSCSVTRDAATCVYSARCELRDARQWFIGYAPAGGLVIGSYCEGKITGGRPGFTDCRFNCVPIRLEQESREADIPPGTVFGIMLQQDTVIGEATSTPSICPPSATQSGAGPSASAGPCPPISISVRDREPFVTDTGVLMAPLRSSMAQLGIPFVFKDPGKIVLSETPTGRLTHVVGTCSAELGGSALSLDAPSVIVDGVLYVPAQLLAGITGRDEAFWSPSQKVITVR